MGCDVKYYNDASDDALLSIAEREGRVLLTRDAELFRRASSKGMKTFFVNGESVVEKLANMAKYFGIKLEVDMFASYCSMCGASLRSVESGAVLDKVPPGTLKHYTKFWVCDDCGKVYWLGRHWKKINETLDKAKALTEKDVT